MNDTGDIARVSMQPSPGPFRADGLVIVGGLEHPHAVLTRPQDWAEPARSILFGSGRIQIGRIAHG